MVEKEIDKPEYDADAWGSVPPDELKAGNLIVKVEKELHPKLRLFARLSLAEIVEVSYNEGESSQVVLSDLSDDGKISTGRSVLRMDPEGFYTTSGWRGFDEQGFLMCQTEPDGEGAITALDQLLTPIGVPKGAEDEANSNQQIAEPSYDE